VFPWKEKVTPQEEGLRGKVMYDAGCADLGMCGTSSGLATSAQLYSETMMEDRRERE
jgi:hypothetical protein